MNKAELMDLGFTGQNYTWRGIRNGQLVEARLDRSLVNASWLSSWQNSVVTNGTCRGSDHSPVLVKFGVQLEKRKNLFRFEAFWTKEEECRDIVRGAWNVDREGNPPERWNSKLNSCRVALIKWSSGKFKDRGRQIKKMVDQLGVLQHDWRGHSKEIEALEVELDHLCKQEECYWQQRSRVQWLREGDANTKFFHHSTIQRRRRNSVVSLMTNNGNWEVNPKQVRRLVDEHFVNLFTSSGQREWGDLLSCVNHMVSDEMNETLSSRVSTDKVKIAAMQMGGLKAPGPDGFPGIFYQAHWDILAADVNEIIGEMMLGHVDPRRINATHLVLIPKVQNPVSISQFRPISLCNYSYKVLSKVLANRLKQFMPTLISPNQNAFVAGRLIQDNIGIAHELFHFLKSRKTRHKFEMCVKLDMHKAYDRVEWDFLLAVMEKMGFDCTWRTLILGCISTVNFSILLNGQPGQKFVPSRGLRQGDPLSPYLFLLVSEVLSLLIQKGCERNQINGIQMSSSGPTVSHILFADDTLIFLKAEEDNCRHLISLIDTYCLASGQQVNKEKSSVYFGANVPVSFAQRLTDILGMVRVGEPGLYLGVPAIWGRSKKCGLAYVKGKLLGKLQGWKKASLSQAGREVLIKAVAQAIPAYPMNLFKFPKTLCNEMDAMITNFWWGQTEGANKIHWLSREKLGRPKEVGGLGLRNFETFNEALLAKQCWRLLMEPMSLWAKVLKARYFPNCSFLDAKRGGRASWAWSSLLVGRNILMEGAHWQIMNGKHVRVWIDRWLPTIPSGKPSPLGSVQVSRNLLVSSLICPVSKGWDIDFLKPFLELEEFDAILETHVGEPTFRDRLVWPFEKRGMYSVKSGYHWAHHRLLPHLTSNSHSSASVPGALWKCIWQLEAPPKIRCFMWKTLNAAIATMTNLYQRRSSTTSLCPICQMRSETITHLFLECPWVKEVWFGGSLSLRINQSEITTWDCWLFKMFDLAKGANEARVHLFSFIAFTCWHIWKARCNFLFNKHHIYPPQVIAAICFSVSAFRDAKTNMPRPIVGCSQVSGGRVSWSPPSSGFVKVNVDGSWVASDGTGFTGVVARDAEGMFLAACRYKVKATSVAMVEAMAIMHGCNLGISKGWRLIVVESDSSDSISCLKNSARNGSWDAFPFIAKCSILGGSFQECRWSWVPRSANSAADLLASRRCKEVCDLIWVNRPPSSLVHVLYNDGLPCPH
ncbi:unnamed protein product [Malus baccata var. baccata]